MPVLAALVVQVPLADLVPGVLDEHHRDLADLAELGQARVEEPVVLGGHLLQRIPLRRRSARKGKACPGRRTPARPGAPAGVGIDVVRVHSG